MPDNFSKEKRSSIMRAIKSKDNKSTELALIKIFKKRNIKGWRRNYKLYGKPDFVFPKKRIVVFTDGCFWHGHSCKKKKPTSNKKYWEEKIEKNKCRDKLVVEILSKKGWKVVRLWECEIKKQILPSDLISLIPPQTTGSD